MIQYSFGNAIGPQPVAFAFSNYPVLLSKVFLTFTSPILYRVPILRLRLRLRHSLRLSLRVSLLLFCAKILLDINLLHTFLLEIFPKTLVIQCIKSYLCDPLEKAGTTIQILNLLL